MNGTRQMDGCGGCGRGALPWVDMVIPEDAAPVIQAVALERAASCGVRSVQVSPRIAAPAARRLRRSRCAVATTSDGVLGWLGASTLRWMSAALTAQRVDELIVRADGGALAIDADVACQLRRATSLCHAHGTLCAIALPISGLRVEQVRSAVRVAVASSADAVILEAPADGIVPGELLAAAVRSASPRTAVRVSAQVASVDALRDMIAVGVDSVALRYEDPVMERLLAQAEQASRAAA